MDKLPYQKLHIAIIMDGNGRWAKQRNLPRSSGHFVGINNILRIINGCRKLCVENLSLYAFSTENWNRPKKEVDSIMNLLYYFLDRELSNMHKKGIHVRVIGKIQDLPEKLINIIEHSEEVTCGNSSLQLNIFFNYGGRMEIIEAIQKLLEYNNKDNLSNNITEEYFEIFLATHEIPNVDILIRTGGEYRLSNFMLWKTVGAYFHVTPTYWPDLRVNELENIIHKYYRSR